MGEMTFEDSMKRIEEIVADLERGDLPLDESLDRFEEAIKLARQCQHKINQARNRIAKLVKADDGSFVLEPFEKSEED
jgi:exodeoxyribonuclease VII small subunit